MKHKKQYFTQEVKERELNAHHGFCRVKNCVKHIMSFHHRLPNKTEHQKRFPLFLQSQFNCAGVCNDHHEGHAGIPGLDVNVKEAAAYEEYLSTITAQR